MAHVCRSIAGVLSLLLLLPALAIAQGTISGTVKDAPGNLLPGVSITLNSPSLPDRSRSAVTNGSGRFSFADLPAGTYSVEFSLPGFFVEASDGITVGDRTIVIIDAQMSVIPISPDTIQITGPSPIMPSPETPIIVPLTGIQSTARQQVLNRDVIAALPTQPADGNEPPLATMYRLDALQRISGKVLALRIRAPQSYLQIEAPDPDGAMHRWTIEWNTSAPFIRTALANRALRPGDAVVAVGRPPRNPEAHVLFLRRISRSDGWSWETFGPDGRTGLPLLLPRSP